MLALLKEAYIHKGSGGGAALESERVVFSWKYNLVQLQSDGSVKVEDYTTPNCWFLNKDACKDFGRIMRPCYFASEGVDTSLEMEIVETKQELSSELDIFCYLLVYILQNIVSSSYEQNCAGCQAFDEYGGGCGQASHMQWGGCLADWADKVNVYGPGAITSLTPTNILNFYHKSSEYFPNLNITCLLDILFGDIEVETKYKIMTEEILKCVYDQFYVPEIWNREFSRLFDFENDIKTEGSLPSVAST